MRGDINCDIGWEIRNFTSALYSTVTTTFTKDVPFFPLMVLRTNRHISVICPYTIVYDVDVQIFYRRRSIVESGKFKLVVEDYPHIRRYIDYCVSFFIFNGYFYMDKVITVVGSCFCGRSSVPDGTACRLWTKCLSTIFCRRPCLPQGVFLPCMPPSTSVYYAP